MVDLDPQCNLTIFSIDMERIHDIWVDEDHFVDDFAESRKSVGAV
jgi:hypothetical protein